MTAKDAMVFISSHGGHLNELLQIREAFTDFEAHYFCYEAETTRRLPNATLVPNRPYSPWRFLRNAQLAHRLFRAVKPAAVVSTGAEIAVAPFLVAKAMGIPTVYVECGAQVETPSTTGRVLCRVADRFFVQWPELLPAYGKRATYAGSLIDTTTPEELAP